MYTYLKRRALPTSLLMRNRILLERQGKFRHIMSNIGATFRNSKWSDYSAQNVTPRLNRLLYTAMQRSVRFMLSIFFGLLSLSLLYVIFINTWFRPYYFAEIIHLALEAIFSWTGLSYKLIPLYIAALWHLLWERGPVRLLQMIMREELPTLVAKPEMSREGNNNNTSSSFSSLSLRPHYTNLLQLGETGVKPIPVLSAFGVLRYPITTRPRLDVAISEPLSIYFLQPRKSATPKYENTLVSKLDRWSIHSICRDMGKLETLERALRGPFYLYSVNYNQLALFTNVPELRFTSTSLRETVKLHKSVRWLYRYSMLHRKSIQRAHFATLTKRLLTSGFYGHGFTSRNLWASSTFFSNTERSPLTSQVLGANFNLLYGNSTGFGDVTKGNASWVDSSLSGVNRGMRNLQYIEESFYFTLKRLYFFNALPTVVFQSVYRPRPSQDAREVGQHLRSARMTHWFLLEAMLSSLNLLLVNLNFNCTPRQASRHPAPLHLSTPLMDTFLTTHDLTVWTDSICTTALELSTYTATPKTVYYFTPLNQTGAEGDSLTFQPKFTLSANSQRRALFYNTSLCLWRVEAKLLNDLRLMSGNGRNSRS